MVLITVRTSEHEESDLLHQIVAVDFFCKAPGMVKTVKTQCSPSYSAVSAVIFVICYHTYESSVNPLLVNFNCIRLRVQEHQQGAGVQCCTKF